MNVSLPAEATQSNGTLFAVIYVHDSDGPPWEDSRHVSYVTRLTSYTTPPAPAVVTAAPNEETEQVKAIVCSSLLEMYLSFHLQ